MDQQTGDKCLIHDTKRHSIAKPENIDGLPFESI